MLFYPFSKIQWTFGHLHLSRPDATDYIDITQPRADAEIGLFYKSATEYFVKTYISGEVNLTITPNRQSAIWNLPDVDIVPAALEIVNFGVENAPNLTPELIRYLNKWSEKHPKCEFQKPS
jgi:hypothetical protein